MKKKISIVAVLALIIIAIVAIYSSNIKKEEIVNNGVDIYFTDKVTETLVTEKRNLTSVETPDKIVEVISYIEKGPTNVNYKKSFFNKYMVYDNIVESIEIKEDYEDTYGMESYSVNIIFNDNYDQLSVVSKILTKSSITLSLTGLEGVSSVSFINDGVFLPVSSTLVDDNMNNYAYTSQNIKSNPIISPRNFIISDIVLYFKSPVEGEGLVKEERRISTDPNEPIEKYIVEELIKGSKEGNMNLIPSGTKLLNINVDNETAFVDLSREFVDGQPDDIMEQTLSVYSIVNSLTELPQIESVQILIEAKRYPGFAGDLDLLNQVLTRGGAYIENIAD